MDAGECLTCVYVFVLTFVQRLEFYYMINYYFKYIELLDTVFLALKKKPLRTVFLSPWCHTHSRVS